MKAQLSHIRLAKQGTKVSDPAFVTVQTLNENLVTSWV